MKVILGFGSYLIIMLAVMQFTAGGALAQSTFKGEKLAESIKKYAENQAGEDASVEVLQLVKDQNFKESGVTAKCSGDRRILRGVCRPAIEFYSEGRIIKKVDIALRVKLFSSVPQAAIPLRSGDLLSAENIMVSKVEVTNIPEADLVAYEELIGVTLKRSVPQGYVITRSALQAPNMIKRGDKVTIVVQSGGVIVKALGTAMDDGAVGASIKVRREGNSRGVMQGIIATDGTILIASQK